MKKIAVLVASAAFLASSSAWAQFSPPVLEIIGTTGEAPGAVGVGQTITLQITFTNPGGSSINGLGISVTDYDEAILDFDSGQAVASYLNSVCVGPGSCFGGLTNLAAPTLAESAIGANGNRVQIGLSAALTPVTATGSVDQGIDNVEGTSQFNVTFVGVAAGTTTLNVGTTYQGDGIIVPGGGTEQATGDSITITVPEPGAIAASMVAFGSVLGLAGIRRRL